MLHSADAAASVQVIKTCTMTMRHLREGGMFSPEGRLSGEQNQWTLHIHSSQLEIHAE